MKNRLDQITQCLNKAAEADSKRQAVVADLYRQRAQQLIDSETLELDEATRWAEDDIEIEIDLSGLEEDDDDVDSLFEKITQSD